MKALRILGIVKYEKAKNTEYHPILSFNYDL